MHLSLDRQRLLRDPALRGVVHEEMMESRADIGAGKKARGVAIVR